jgi:hypothetical protein
MRSDRSDMPFINAASSKSIIGLINSLSVIIFLLRKSQFVFILSRGCFGCNEKHSRLKATVLLKYPLDKPPSSARFSPTNRRGGYHPPAATAEREDTIFPCGLYGAPAHVKRNQKGMFGKETHVPNIPFL